MKTEFFHYTLPEELVAQHPAIQRDASRLLVCRASDKLIKDHLFQELPVIIQNLFMKNGKTQPILLIVNDSRVYPARVRIQRKSGAKGEVFLLECKTKQEQGALSPSSYLCLLRPKSKLKVGEILLADHSGPEEIPLFRVENLDTPRVSPVEGKTLNDILSKYGETPLPPYIRRETTTSADIFAEDRERYQTVYSHPHSVGSSAAPTAGLHFTPEILTRCHNLGITFAPVTLHVGLGTFSPVQTSQIEEHEIHEEFYFVPGETAKKLQEFLLQGFPIIFVGTTSLRTVESFLKNIFPSATRDTLVEQLRMSKNDLSSMADAWRSTRLFIHPQDLESRYKPLAGNAIVTNFHQPESTLVMLVAALMGYQFWREFYHHAIAQHYRFFSYGDSSLLIFEGENQS